MHGTRILEEADRLMTVCNSCRYCEGLCAVFPAMEMRRAFSDGDLNYLANLCHACGACYTDCQFSPPHEYNVNVPQTLAIARAESYAAYAWPRALSGLFARNGLAISLIAALSVAAFIFGFAAVNDHAVLFGVHTGPGAFYQLMPHNAMAALFGAAFLYAIVALAMGVRAFWRDIGEPVGMHADPASLFQAMRDAGELRYLDGGGVGCFNEDDRPTDRRKIYHHLTFYGFVLCFAATSVGDALSLSARARGAICVVGFAGRARHARRHRTGDRPDRPADREMETRSRAGRPGAGGHGCRLYRDAVADRADRSRAAVAARHGRDGPAAGAASRRGVRAVPYPALWQVRARHLSLRRAGALRAGAADDGATTE